MVMPIQSNPGTAFDPRMHEAIEMVDDPDWETNTIVTTAQVGYTYRKRLVRPARVVVSSGKASATEKIIDDETIDDLSAGLDETSSEPENDANTQGSTESTDAAKIEETTSADET